MISRASWESNYEQGSEKDVLVSCIGDTGCFPSCVSPARVRYPSKQGFSSS